MKSSTMIQWNIIYCAPMTFTGELYPWLYPGPPRLVGSYPQAGNLSWMLAIELSLLEATKGQVVVLNPGLSPNKNNPLPSPKFYSQGDRRHQAAGLNPKP